MERVEHLIHAGDCFDLVCQPAVDFRFAPDAELVGDSAAYFGFGGVEYLLVAHPGKPDCSLLGGDWISGFGQKLGIDPRGNDFRIDEHAVAVEYNQHVYLDDLIAWRDARRRGWVVI